MDKRADMDNKQMSMIMAERLKEERERKCLSHAKLSAEIRQKYNISISRDSLINYEVKSEHYAKSFSNNGMRVEYLRYLSDFYNVSADWLLGLDTNRTKDSEVAQVANTIGISEKAAKNLKRGASGYWPALNSLLENERFWDFLKLIEIYGQGGTENGHAWELINHYIDFSIKHLLPRESFETMRTKTVDQIFLGVCSQYCLDFMKQYKNDTVSHTEQDSQAPAEEPQKPATSEDEEDISAEDARERMLQRRRVSKTPENSAP